MGRRPRPTEVDPDAYPIYTSETAPKTLFTRNGEPIKFFIQRDTGKQFIAWLSSTIAKHGGHVVEVVPLTGYVLIDPPTPSGQRLCDKWLKPHERPTRCVVSYTFVRACIVAGELLPAVDMEGAMMVFRGHSGLPVDIWLHPALAPDVRRSTAIDIEKYGGSTETTEADAQVIIAPRTTKQEIVLWNDLVRKHDPDESKFLEDVEWVNRCIETKEFEKTVHRKRNLGGRKAGAKRVEFTERDDQDLVAYIAEKIPYAEAGGRLGNNLYMELEANIAEYPWAARHSWHSWRNRYKIRQLIFDIAIRDYVKAHPVAEGEPTSAAAGTSSSKGKKKLNASTSQRPGHPALIPFDAAADPSADDGDDVDIDMAGEGSYSAPRPRRSRQEKMEYANADGEASTSRPRPRPRPRLRKRLVAESDSDSNPQSEYGVLRPVIPEVRMVQRGEYDIRSGGNGEASTSPRRGSGYFRDGDKDDSPSSPPHKRLRT